MSDPAEPRLSKWPFFLGDLLLLGAGMVVYVQSARPMLPWQAGLLVVCVAAGACLGIMPFLLQYRLQMKLAQAEMLSSTVAQIQNLEGIAAQIAAATGRWNNVHEEAEKTAATAKGIAERMQSEAKAFAEFMQRANDTEKGALRLEVDKLRRAEGDWLQVAVRMLDHVFALNQGALRSGQAGLIEQLGNFQNACRDAARRVGLTPLVPEPAEPFDPHRHQVLDGDGQPQPDARVAETIATGYSFQGKLLRPALVRVREPREDEAEPGVKLVLPATEPNPIEGETPATEPK